MTRQEFDIFSESVRAKLLAAARSFGRFGAAGGDDPKDIKSIEVIKDSSAAKYLQDLKDRGKFNGDVNASGGVIIVTLK